MQNITSYLGEAHVTSDQFRGIIESIVGDGTYIANLDEQLEPELSTNNTLKIRSGVLIHHGHVMRVPPGTYDTVTYINGSQGMKRIDLVVARYEKNSETKKEPTKWVVIQGTPDASSPVAPDYNEGNMQDGDLIDDCPVFEMHFDGINVTEVKKLVEVTKNIDDLRKGYDELYSALSWSNWIILGANSLGITIKYRYNAYEVELIYSGTLSELNITGGSFGYTFPSLPNGLNPNYNIEHPIYACAGNNSGALTLRCFPDGDPNVFTITSHKNIKTTEEYICGYIRYLRN
ncbi:hypothetical protein MR857_13200 [bacterium]|nr:hypothetical protein [bacterium]MDY3022363.1 hypothetical protein [Oliverpabstia sp.]